MELEYAPEESKYNKSFLYTEVLISLSNYVSTHFPHLTLYKPFNLLRRFDTFIPKLKDALKENWQLMLEKDLLLLDEANSMTYRVFAKLVDKNN